MESITIRELAALAGVAVSTASRAVNGRPEVSAETRERVLGLARKYDYVPNSSARSLKIHDNNVIAILVQGALSALFVPIIDMLNRAIKDRGYEPLLTYIPDDQADPSTVTRIVRDRKISGVVFLGRYSEVGKGALSSYRLAELGTPAVFCTTEDFSGSPAKHSSVSVDDPEWARRAVEHLIGLGHSRIACIGTGVVKDAGQAWALRARGYEEAMRAIGGFDPRYLRTSAVPESVYSFENGYATARALIDSGLDVTAVFGICDAIAIGACKALMEAGLRVPGDVSVMGFDGLDFGRFHTPALTTIVQPLDRIVAETVDVLFAVIENPGTDAVHLRLPGLLSARESTAAPRRG